MNWISIETARASFQSKYSDFVADIVVENFCIGLLTYIEPMFVAGSLCEN